MDELSAFKEAPPELPALERQLLARADIVLTGGPSLYEAKRHAHPNVHCMPSAVDARHFAPGGRGARSRLARHAAETQSAIAHPRLGFYGVIDERLDLPLIDRLAQDNPGWQIVMAGPVVKLDGVQLPRHDNLHWLGQQDYAVLPHLVAGWDVCLMPFAINRHTEFISPTKTLEYLAAGKPVVSTPVRDVVSLYGNVVSLAADPASFAAACAAALAESPRMRVARRALAATTVARSSWDAAATRALHLMAQALEQSQVPARAPAARARGRVEQPG
jgi:UDP-galactopyranose mutase